MDSIKSELKSLFTAHWNYLTVVCACKISLFDKIVDCPLNVKELSENLDCNLKALKILLSALIKIGYLAKTDETYLLTEKSMLLTENHPESLKYACLNWTDEHLLAWTKLDYSIKTGKSSFENLYGQNYFDYLNTSESKLSNYHKAMLGYAKDDYKNIAVTIDFSNHKSVMDVGGGYGVLIENIKLKNPSIDCFLFDLEKVVSKYFHKNINKLAGNFFIEIPQFAEVHILSRILHDWDDLNAKIILKNCFNALPKNGFLYIIENMLDEFQDDLAFLSLNMLALCGSIERTKSQYISLAQFVGFNFNSEKSLNSLQTILIFRKP